MLKQRAKINAQPNIEMMPMLDRIAIGPALSAPFVSSVKCAAESYPYSEYWLTRKDRMTA